MQLTQRCVAAGKGRMPGDDLVLASSVAHTSCGSLCCGGALPTVRTGKSRRHVLGDSGEQGEQKYCRKFVRRFDCRPEYFAGVVKEKRDLHTKRKEVKLSNNGSEPHLWKAETEESTL